jgi:hypothetical protein
MPARTHVRLTTPESSVRAPLSCKVVRTPGLLSTPVAAGQGKYGRRCAGRRKNFSSNFQISTLIKDFNRRETI